MANWNPSDQFENWPGCRACRHYKSGAKCVAYPKLIPFGILVGTVDHMVLRPGQRGKTLFEWSSKFRRGSR